VFKYTVLRNTYGPGRQEVTGNWRKLQREEELHNFYTSLDINKIVKPRWMRWSACVAHTGQKRKACRILVGKSEGKRPPSRPRHRWDDNILVDIA
jgi:hypothetical protein